MRRGVLVAAAALLLGEALLFALLGLVMGLAVRRQEMSIGGLSTDAMAVGAWVGQGLLALFLLVCAVVAVRAGLRVGSDADAAVRAAHRTADRTAVRARALLICCAVLHGLLGAVLFGLSGVPVFTALMVVLAVLVLAVLALGEPAGAAPPVDAASVSVAGSPEPA